MYVLNEEQSALIMKVAYLSLISAAYALYQNHYDLFFVPAGVFVTSLLYWKKPKHDSWRRYIDMSYVALALLYQLVIGSTFKYYNIYLMITTISILCYLLSVYCKNRNMTWKSTYLHCLLHVSANVGNIILYTT
jgi:hypothetical protein